MIPWQKSTEQDSVEYSNAKTCNPYILCSMFSKLQGAGIASVHWNTRPSLFCAFFAIVSANPIFLFFQLLVNGICFIRECGSTLYVGLAHTALPTNANFRLTFLLTRLQEALCEDLSV